ncbi:type II toxin-antitoxin system Phd/YefM family antitoxin [candidate division KSB1 bacterium]|nr:type II toxin-antitoxin system Phd/YefM family antitoxin [candidate division KSB1 bacterium]
MSQLNISRDIVPVNEAKNQLSKHLREINDHNSTIIITQHGKARGVLISPERYDELVYEKNIRKEIELGLNDIKSGAVYSIDDISDMLDKDGE